MKDMIRSRFDEILDTHFERLIGTSQGIGGIPLNLASIGCIVLLGVREIEIESSSAEAPERFTRDTLLKEAADLGIGPDEFLETALQDMIQRGYCEVDPEDRFLSRQPALTMTRLLDRVFPKMPGINFLAFIGQTIEEVVTGRNDLEAAISRFDQNLHRYGVPFTKQKSQDAPTPPASESEQRKIPINREDILAKLYSKDKISPQGPVSPSGRRSHRVLSGDSVPAPVEINVISARNEGIRDIEERTKEVKKEEKFEKEAQANAHGDIITSADHQDAALITEKVTPAVPQDRVSDDGQAPPFPDETSATSDETGADELTTTDDVIADRIAAFEKDLALTCPICRVSTLKEQATAAGKIFYTCPSDTCNFISWGKPHPLECKRCKNPFLVEVTDTTGKTILKCPRATCQHHQDINPTRKLVRKRLVRRRK
jgi:hypothetical protein